NDWLVCKCSSKCRDTFNQFLYIEFDWRCITCSTCHDCCTCFTWKAVNIDQCFRVNTNHTVNNEFKTRHTNTCVWHLSKVKCTVRVTHVHHYFKWKSRHRLN